MPSCFAKCTALIALLAVLCSGCKRQEAYPWYETVSAYHVFLKAFYDSDNDGKGDLKGLTQKLDYVKSLNVNSIYLMPITPALNVDEMPRSHYGYEITDFKNIHPDYGTMDDFKELTRQAHKRDLRIVLDFITTVISVQHPFFQDILKNPDSKYKDWIITANEIPDGEWMNFNDYSEQFESSAWKPLPFGGYYYSLWGNSPFLNYHNPEVQEYMLSVIDFWLDAGADGFRIDATKHLFINGPGQENQYHQPENFEFWKKLRRHIRQKHGEDKVLIAETVPIPNDYAYVVKDREMFDLMFDSTFINDVYPYKETDLNLLYSAQYLHSFFANPSVYKLTPLKDRMIYHSDHDGARIATRLKNPTADKLKTAASILILTPAHFKIYAGDEIGIKGFSDFRDSKNKWFHATVASMAWDNSRNGGFTQALSSPIPVTDDYHAWNVKAQEKDKSSLLNHYRRLIALKNDYPALFYKGRRSAVLTNNPKVYAYYLTHGKEAALVIINSGNKPALFETALPAAQAGKERLIFGEKDTVKITRTDKTFKIDPLPAYGTYVFKFDDFDTATLPEIRTDMNGLSEQTVSPGTTVESNATTAYLPELPEENGVLRLFKDQGVVTVSLFERYNENNLSQTFVQPLDTTGKDVLLPLLGHKAAVATFDKSGIRFAIEATSPVVAVPENLPLLAGHDGYHNLKRFYAGKDENFWYFKMDRDGDALPSNGGLDFILLINEKQKGRYQQRLSFWRLPDIVSRIPVNDLILYERHIKNGRVQTDVNQMRNIGVAALYGDFIFDTPDAFVAMVSRRLLPQDSLKVAPFVWSAVGNWGEKPPVGQPLPIVEHLPYSEATDPHTLIKDYLDVK